MCLTSSVFQLSYCNHDDENQSSSLNVRMTNEEITIFSRILFVYDHSLLYLVQSEREGRLSEWSTS